MQGAGENRPGKGPKTAKWNQALRRIGGKILRILEHADIAAVLKEFVRAFREKAIFPEKKRLLIKEYPAYAGDALKDAGFSREMMDYVLYR